MKKITRIICIVSTLSVLPVYAGAEPDMNPGKWEMTTRMEMEGMPFVIPPVVFTQCLTKEKMLPRSSDRNSGECKVLDSKVSGNTVSWTMQCPDSKITGEVTYQGTAMEGTMFIEANDGPKMKSHISGKYMSPCD